MTLREDFQTAAQEILDNLEIPITIKYNFFETKNVGLDYIARSEPTIPKIEFSIRTETTESDPTSGRMRAFLTIDFDESLASFSYSEDITPLKIHSSYLSRWVFWAIFNYRIKHDPINLDGTFQDTTIRVYGSPGYGADEELEVLLKGMLLLPQEKVTCFKFGHVREGDYYRKISYALFIQPTIASGYWAFFPDCAGLDSGGAYMSYRQTEELLAELGKKKKVEIRRADIDYDSLKLFLLKNGESFFTLCREESSNIITMSMEPRLITEDHERNYQIFIDRYEKKQFPQALRDLRALVQDLQEEVLKLNGVDVPPKPSVVSCAIELRKNEIIGDDLQSWFEAFARIANPASHGNYPSKEEMEDSLISERVYLTFKIGLHLLRELSKVPLE